MPYKLPSYEEARRQADNRRELKERCRFCSVVFCITFVTARSLIVGGFLLPPMGIIDGSVLTAVGELIAFPALAFGMRAVELGYELRFSNGDKTINISNPTNDE